VDLGKLPRGSAQEATVQIANRTSSSVQIVEFRRSCECLAIEPSRLTIAAGAVASIRIRVDLSRETHFTGPLEVEVEGLTESVTIAMAFTVNLDVSSQ
jgi:hypothetical protein